MEEEPAGTKNWECKERQALKIYVSGGLEHELLYRVNKFFHFFFFYFISAFLCLHFTYQHAFERVTE